MLTMKTMTLPMADTMGAYGDTKHLTGAPQTH